MQQGAGDIDAPPLAAGELAHRTLQQVAEIQQGRQLPQPCLKLLAADAVQGGTASEIVPHGQVLIQHGGLKHHAQAALDGVRVGIRVFAADGNGAAVLGQLAAEDVDGGGFSRTVDTQEGEHLPLLHPEAQVLNRVDLAVGFVQVFNFNDIVHCFVLSSFHFFRLPRGQQLKAHVL